jgi:protein gp37
MNKTAIEYADFSWNPTRGCRRVSPGCEHCYAERIAARFSRSDHQTKTRAVKHGPFFGIANMTPSGPRWTGKVALIDAELTAPLRARRSAEKFLREHGRKPRVFVCDMSDLFYEQVPDEWIDRIFAVMALAPWFDYLVLTKRTERMLKYFSLPLRHNQIELGAEKVGPGPVHLGGKHVLHSLPFPHVRLGGSVEDQQRADERLPHLMTLAAAGWQTFVSAEPLLSPIHLKGEGVKLGWLILGGESGPGARPCEIDWIRSLVQQGKAAEVPVFVKQLGARPMDGAVEWRGDSMRGAQPLRRVCLRHPKGGDPTEWPADLRVKDFPTS